MSIDYQISNWSHWLIMGNPVLDKWEHDETKNMQILCW